MPWGKGVNSDMAKLVIPQTPKPPSEVSRKTSMTPRLRRVSKVIAATGTGRTPKTPRTPSFSTPANTPIGGSDKSSLLSSVSARRRVSSVFSFRGRSPSATPRSTPRRSVQIGPGGVPLTVALAKTVRMRRPALFFNAALQKQESVFGDDLEEKPNKGQEGGADGEGDGDETSRRTPLHAAIHRGDRRMAKGLIQKGAHIHDVDGNGWTPLHCAADMGDSLNLYELLQFGANPHAVTLSYERTALHIAAVRGHEDACKILLEFGADPNLADDDGKTTMHLAAIAGSLPICNDLTGAGAAADIKDNNGDTPLAEAIIHGRNNVIFFLCHLDVGINTKNIDGHTPLHLAARYGRDAAISLLIEKGADPTARDRKGHTPTDLTMNPLIKETIRKAAAEWITKNMQQSRYGANNAGNLRKVRVSLFGGGVKKDDSLKELKKAEEQEVIRQMIEEARSRTVLVEDDGGGVGVAVEDEKEADTSSTSGTSTSSSSTDSSSNSEASKGLAVADRPPKKLTTRFRGELADVTPADYEILRSDPTNIVELKKRLGDSVRLRKEGLNEVARMKRQFRMLVRKVEDELNSDDPVGDEAKETAETFDATEDQTEEGPTVTFAADPPTHETEGSVSDEFKRKASRRYSLSGRSLSALGVMLVPETARRSSVSESAKAPRRGVLKIEEEHLSVTRDALRLAPPATDRWKLLSHIDPPPPGNVPCAVEVNQDRLRELATPKEEATGCKRPDSCQGCLETLEAATKRPRGYRRSRTATPSKGRMSRKKPASKPPQHSAELSEDDTTINTLEDLSESEESDAFDEDEPHHDHVPAWEMGLQHQRMYSPSVLAAAESPSILVQAWMSQANRPKARMTPTTAESWHSHPEHSKQPSQEELSEIGPTFLALLDSVRQVEKAEPPRTQSQTQEVPQTEAVKGGPTPTRDPTSILDDLSPAMAVEDIMWQLAHPFPEKPKVENMQFLTPCATSALDENLLVDEMAPVASRVASAGRKYAQGVRELRTMKRKQVKQKAKQMKEYGLQPRIVARPQTQIIAM